MQCHLPSRESTSDIAGHSIRHCWTFYSITNAGGYKGRQGESFSVHLEDFLIHTGGDAATSERSHSHRPKC